MPHTWKFFRAGGFDQVRLDSAADLLAIGDLDQKLWVALSCPVQGIEFDARTLQLIDADADGQVRAPELINAVQWAGTRLKDTALLVAGLPGVPLALVGLMLIVSGPAVVMAWFKLRSRNLGPILDANGWAINARARINIPFGTSLTQLAQLPEGSERSLADPYADKETPWGLLLFFAAVAAAATWWWLRH